MQKNYVTFCATETYKRAAKLPLPRGASPADPRGRFNADHDGNTRRVIDIREGGSLNAAGFKILIRAAEA